MLDVFEYHRGKLNKRYDSLYADIFHAVKNRQETLDVTGFDYDTVAECYNAVSYDHAELFYLSHQCNAQVSRSLRGSRITLMFDYIYTEQEVINITRKIAPIVRQTKGINQEDTENKIVGLIVKNTVYEVDITYNQNMASALCFGKAQCSGIAKAVKYLCDCNNIRCIFVNGSIKASGGGPHAWNIIEINGNYYHLDVTTILASNPAGAAKLFKPCFNWNDNQMLATHGWDSRNFPACLKTFSQPAQGDTAAHMPERQARAGYTPPPKPNGQIPQGNRYGQGVKKITTLMQLRAYVEEQLKAQKREIVFTLTLGSSPEEKMKLIANAVKMVTAKLHMSGNINIEITGEVGTVKII